MRRRRRTANEEGSVAVEAAIVLPLVVLLSMLALQIAVREHARDTARTAARLGLDSARILDGTEAEAHAAASEFLAGGGDGLVDPEVSVSQGAEQVTVTVTSDVLSLTPLWTPTVTVTVIADRERFVP
jgi:TadE-like protein